jgi:enoyl-CoA hydratase/carnithine racemase
MDYQQILYQVEDEILTLTLNRPDQLNALTSRMVSELIDALDRADADDGIGAVVVTGAGRAFCAGADLEDWSRSFGPGGSEASGGLIGERDVGGLLALRLFDCTKPVIAAVNGAAVGAGATLQLPMDVRLAAEDARFGFVFTRRGIVPDAAASWFLPRIVGISRALEWAMSGRVFPASEALAGGLVRSLHPSAELIPAARALAREFLDKTSRVAVPLVRQLFWRMLGADHPMEAHRVDSRLIRELASAADCQEGITAFLEKREPVFRMRPGADMPPSYPWWKPRTP